MAEAKFGKDQDPNSNENMFVDESINQSQAELNDRRDRIAAQQLAIAKSQGGESWNPTPIYNPSSARRTSAAGQAQAIVNKGIIGNK